MAEAGTPVLLIDLDPQANATTGLGFRPEQLTASTYDLLHGKPLDEGQERFGVGRLNEIRIRPQLKGAQDVGVVVGGGQHRDGQAR